jgi:hypothetical protein
MVDLPNHSVLIGGLDSWSTGGEEIVEPRLIEKLKLLFDPPLQVLKLYRKVSNYITRTKTGKPK